jgi:DNA invertase Pin-like site-specific DNA recombinase
MSHRQSASSGISEEVQLQVALDWLRANSVYTSLGESKFPQDSPAGVFIDRAESGWSKDFHQRPAGYELLKVLKPGDHIVFYNVERSFRNTLNCLRWIAKWTEQGVTPHFIMENIDFSTAGGKFVGTIAAAAAEYYSNISSERIKEALGIRRLRLGQTSKVKPKSKQEWIPSDIKPALKTESPQQISGSVRVYNRVSSKDQEISGLSMENQRNENLGRGMKLIASQKAIGMTVYEDESVSSFSKKFNDRPAASRLMHDLKAGDHVVIHRTDRAFRNLRDAVETEATFRDMGVFLHLTREGISTDTEYGRMFFHVLAIFAELESSIKRRRKLDMNNWLRSQGRPTNALPQHQKVVMVGSAKKLAFDFDAIIDVFCMWIMREAGISWDEVNSYAMAIKGRRLGKLPVGKRTRFKKSKDCFVITETRMTMYAVGDVGKILDDLPEELAKDLIAAALVAIQTPVDPLSFRHCLHQIRFPLVDIEDRLSSRDIDARLLRLLPSRAQCATAPA